MLPGFVVVGSKNVPKIEAVRMAFAAVWPDRRWLVKGISIESGVSDQPLDEFETIAGARNRAYEAIKQTDCEYAVGIEGGLIHSAGRWMECGWMIVLDRHGREGIGASVKIMVPDKFLKQMKNGKNLGDVCDEEFATRDIGQGVGYFGLVTNNAVTRTDGYRDGVAIALARFTNPQLFEEE